MILTEPTKVLTLTRTQVKTSTPTKSAKEVAKPLTKAKSKQETVLALLSTPTGTTLKMMVKATGWQRHSVRGFLAGVVRKKLKLNLIPTMKGDERVYRIGRRAPAKRATTVKVGG